MLKPSGFSPPAHFSAQLLVEYKNMDCQKENQCNRNHAVENQYHGVLIQNHTEESTGKGNQDHAQQKPAPYAQFLSVSNGMDDAQQQKNDGCKLVNMDTGQRNQNGHDEADQQGKVQNFFHAAATSVAGIVLIPKIK